MSIDRFPGFVRRVAGAVAAAVLLTTVSASVIPSAAYATYSTGTGQSMPDRLMSDLQRDYGLTASQAAGWVGNFGHESGNFKFQEELVPNKYGTKGYGFAQWTGPRRTALFNYAAKNGYAVNSYEAQYGYLRSELDGSYGYVMDAVRNASSLEEATAIVMNKFERPNAKYAHLDRRMALAQGYMTGDFSGAGLVMPDGSIGTGGATPNAPRVDVVLMPWT